MKPRRHLPKPRIQRAFVLWFRENRRAFNVPVRLVKVSAASILLNFPSYPDCLSVWLSRWDLSVVVTWQGTCWDLLLNVEAVPKSVLGGYTCSLCIDDTKIWKTREDLWVKHLFSPFLLWVNEKLATAGILNLYGHQDSSTSAVLTVSNSPASERLGLQVLIHPEK